LLGAIFGVALYFAMKSGALNLQRISVDSGKDYLFLFVAFLGGFSERFAPDVLTASERYARPKGEDRPKRDVDRPSRGAAG
jgi:hypothetical protein